MSDWVCRQAQQRPDHPAIIDDQGTVLTFAALEQRIVDQCRKFQQARVPSEAVLFSLLPAGPDFVVLLHATRRLGGMLAVASPEWTAKEIQRAVKLAAPDWVFLDASLGEAARMAAQASGAAIFRREPGKPDPIPSPGETLPSQWRCSALKASKLRRRKPIRYRQTGSSRSKITRSVITVRHPMRSTRRCIR